MKQLLGNTLGMNFRCVEDKINDITCLMIFATNHFRYGVVIGLFDPFAKAMITQRLPGQLN